MTWLLTLSLAAVWTTSVRISAEPVVPCPGDVVGNYYLADSVNRLLYYWCHQGHLMVHGRALRCPVGSRTIPNAHGGSPVCFRPLIYASSTKAPPAETTMNKGMFYVETYKQRHILAGRFHPGFTTAYNCVHACFEHPKCVGADFDNEARTCWLHDNTSACNELLPSDCCTHYRLTDMCPTAMSPIMPPTTPLMSTQSRETQFAAPKGSFVKDKFAAPTALPSGWQAYPGMHISGGDVIGEPGMSGSECFELCRANSTCLAVTFSSTNGICRSHVAAEKCDLLLSAAFMYHAKKAPPCTVITGTVIRYPPPAATAP
ncbi:hypothetical protein LSAT2_015026 [Lamellibrachia satsuma]|nr:hypothetical protein LSAT2_015026 [Lamellibrachia satsuma]